MTDWKATQRPRQFNVLLIGETCKDIYKLVSVKKLSPEAPIPIANEVEEYFVPGMAANVKRNLENLGIEQIDFITNDWSITKTRYVDVKSGYQLLRVDNDGIGTPWSSRFIDNVENYSAIVISDYNKGFLSYEQIEFLIKSTTKPVFIDTKKTDLKRFCAKNVFIKINEYEYLNASSLPKKLIITMGDRGAIYKNRNSELKLHTKLVDVVDVCGCGDTFLAALVVKYLYTKNIEQSIIFANIAAGLTVQHRGNYAPNYNEIEND